MSESEKSFMVIVTDDEDETSGGIAFFGTEAEVAAHVEALLENGKEQKNVSVFAVKALPTEVRYRPVVSIVPDAKTAHDPESVSA
jgi:hypothetical protein